MAIIKSWLARLSFSFLVLAVLLGWTVYREYPVTGVNGLIILAIIGSIVSFALFLIGTRLRHRG